jgi:tetratricopeptide (TPR) repeat protein
LAREPTIQQVEAALEAIVGLHRAGAALMPLATALRKLGHVRLQQGNAPAALEAWQEASNLLRAIPLDPAAAAMFVDALIDLGGLLCAAQRGEAAEAPLLEVTAILRGEARATGQFAWALNLLAASRQLTGRAEDALAALYEAEAVAQAIARESQSPRDAASWALILNNIGRAEIAVGRPQDACRTLETCLAVTRELVQADGSPNDLTLHSAVSNRYGRALEQIGRQAAALPYYSEAVEIMRALVSGGRQDLAEDLADVEADLTRLHGTLAATR